MESHLNMSWVSVQLACICENSGGVAVQRSSPEVSIILMLLPRSQGVSSSSISHGRWRWLWAIKLHELSVAAQELQEVLLDAVADDWRALKLGGTPQHLVHDLQPITLPH